MISLKWLKYTPPSIFSVIGHAPRDVYMGNFKVKVMAYMYGELIMAEWRVCVNKLGHYLFRYLNQRCFLLIKTLMSKFQSTYIFHTRKSIKMLCSKWRPFYIDLSVFNHDLSSEAINGYLTNHGPRSFSATSSMISNLASRTCTTCHLMP